MTCLDPGLSPPASLFSYSSSSNPSNNPFSRPFQEFCLLYTFVDLYSSFLWHSLLIFESMSFYLDSSANFTDIFSALERRSLDFACKSSIIISMSSSLVHFLSSTAAVALPNSPAFYLCLMS